MRIVHAINRIDPLDGGPPAAVVRLAAAQAAQGHEVVIVANDSVGRAERCAAAFGRVPGYGAITMRLVPAGGLLEHLTARRAAAVLIECIEAADVVHVHGVWRPILVQAIIIARRYRRPYVVSPHGMLSIWSVGQKQVRKRLALAWFWREALGRAQFVHVLNQDEQHAVQSLGIAGRRVIAPNGVFPEEFLAAANSNGVGHGAQPARRRHITYVGRLHYSKGLDILADAFAAVAPRCPDVDLVVIGPDFGYRSEFERLIAQRNIATRVHLLDAVFGDEKNSLLRTAECFCLPSRQEGFSMALLEALACGAPVVISDACHFPQQRLGGAGFVVELQAAAFAQALISICTDEQLKQRSAASARSLIEEEFTWPKIAGTLCAGYRSATTVGRASAIAR